MRRIRLTSMLMIGLLSIASSRAPAEEPSKTPTADLLGGLDSSKFRERDAAHKELLKRDGDQAEIRRLLPTLGAEGRKRARSVLDVMTQRRTKRFLQYGREGRVDLLVEWSAFAGKMIDQEQFWQCVFDVAWENIRRSRSKEDMDAFTRLFPAQDYFQFLKSFPTFLNDSEEFESILHPIHVVVRTAGITSKKSLLCSIVVSNGSVELSGMTSHSLIVATGDIRVGRAMNSVLITDGDVQVNFPSSNVIIARGSVGSSLGFPEMDGRRTSSAVRDLVREWKSAEDGEPEMYDLLYRPGEPARRIYLPGPRGDSEEKAVTEAKVAVASNDDEPPPRDDGVRFFELSDIGVKLHSDGGKLRVESLRTGSPLAKAGLKRGDVLWQIDNIGLPTANAARRMLRRAFILGGCELTVERGDKRLRLPVSLFGWELPVLKKPAK